MDPWASLWVKRMLAWIAYHTPILQPLALRLVDLCNGREINETFGYPGYCRRCGVTIAEFIDGHDFGSHYSARMRCLKCGETFIWDGARRRQMK